ncbi:hypothetical protein TGARI_372000, partial [Toxoplasma gondii ARI]
MGRHLTGSRPAVTRSAVSTLMFVGRRIALRIADVEGVIHLVDEVSQYVLSCYLRRPYDRGLLVVGQGPNSERGSLIAYTIIMSYREPLRLRSYNFRLSGNCSRERRARLQLFASPPPHDLRCCLPNGAAAAACGFGVSQMMAVLAMIGVGDTARADVAMLSAFRGCLDLVDATQFRSPIWCDQEFLHHGSRRGVWAPALPLQQGTKAYGSVMSRERRGRSHAIAFA